MSFPLFSWNTGGVSETDYVQAISDWVEGIPGNALVVLQEVARQDPGWHRQTQGAWQMLLHRDPDAWRGVGLIFKPSEWSVMRRKTTERGAWFRVRHVTGVELWVGTAHFTPGTSQTVHASQVSAHLQGLPATHLPVLLGCDVNSVMSWCLGEQEEGMPAAKNGKTFEFLSQCRERGLKAVGPLEHDFTTPTSRPRQEHRVGSQIDAILGARVCTQPLCIYQGSHKALGTDHELLSTEVQVRQGRAGRPHRSSPRIWIGGLREIEGELSQPVLADLAKSHTRTRPGTRMSGTPLS